MRGMLPRGAPELARPSTGQRRPISIGNRRLYWGWSSGSRCLQGMEPASYYRAQAEHLRRLAKLTWQDNLEDFLRILAKDYEEVAEDLVLRVIQRIHKRV